MIKNYEIDELGIIKQKEIANFNYDEKYIQNSYDSYGEVLNYMSYLRLGYIIGSIGKIPKSILDVGYGNGNFLKTCKTIISECYGNDINGYQIPDNCIFVDNIFTKKFEVITFFDSLEHFHSIEFVSELKCDFICISVPWCHYFNDEWFDKWKHRKENEHIFHFNENSLVNFMRKSGYELINYANVEDTIRKNKPNEKNILTGIFKKL